VTKYQEKIHRIMIEIKEFKAVHTGEVLGHLASEVRKRLKISRFVLGSLIKEGFIVVEIKEVINE